MDGPTLSLVLLGGLAIGISAFGFDVLKMFEPATATILKGLIGLSAVWQTLREEARMCASLPEPR